MKPKSLWQRFREDRPGHRFQNLYRRRRDGKSGRFPAKRIFNVVGAIGLLVVGLILLPAPGPGWLVIVVALGLMACEFLAFARCLDSAEVHVRSWLSARRRPKLQPSSRAN
jgi:hypothetical protein